MAKDKNALTPKQQVLLAKVVRAGEKGWSGTADARSSNSLETRGLIEQNQVLSHGLLWWRLFATEAGRAVIQAQEAK